MLIITHDLQAAEYVCDTLSMLALGRIVESGPTSDVINSPQTSAAQHLFASTVSSDAEATQAPAGGHR